MGNERKPGDAFLDCYMPNASEIEREEARQNMYEFFTVLLRIATRRANEDHEEQIRAKGGQGVKLDGGVSPSL